MKMPTWVSGIRSKGKFLFDLVLNDTVKVQFMKALPFWIASLLVGLIAVCYTILFGYAEKLMHVIFRSNLWLAFLLGPICLIIGWWVVRRFAPAARGSGIPQVMAAIEMSGRKEEPKVDVLLNGRVIVVKILSSLFMVAGGSAVGREGPTIQIASSVFRLINKYIPVDWPKLSRQSFILTGAAAGLAAAFNTPLGGMVFAMEELARIHIRFFRTALFSAVIIAGLTAQGLLGPYLYLGYPNISGISFSIFFGVVLTALLAGLAGAGMSQAILLAMKRKSAIKTRMQHILFISLISWFIVVVAQYLNPEILGSGKDLMARVLFTDHKETSWDTVLLRILGPILSFSTGAAGGVFAPSLAAGASLGAWLAGLFHIIGANANILILTGMVGFLTGVTRTPFTSAILVLEMTDRHSVIFHLMIAAMIAYLAAMAFGRHSFYDVLKKQFNEIRK